MDEYNDYESPSQDVLPDLTISDSEFNVEGGFLSEDTNVLEDKYFYNQDTLGDTAMDIPEDTDTVDLFQSTEDSLWEDSTYHAIPNTPEYRMPDGTPIFQDDLHLTDAVAADGTGDANDIFRDEESCIETPENVGSEMVFSSSEDVYPEIPEDIGDAADVSFYKELSAEIPEDTGNETYLSSSEDVYTEIPEDTGEEIDISSVEEPWTQVPEDTELEEDISLVEETGAGFVEESEVAENDSSIESVPMESPAETSEHTADVNLENSQMSETAVPPETADSIDTSSSAQNLLSGKIDDIMSNDSLSLEGKIQALSAMRDDLLASQPISGGDLDNEELSDSNITDEDYSPKVLQRILKRDDVDVNAIDQNIKNILDLKADDYRDKGYSEDEISVMLTKDRLDLEQEFLRPRIPDTAVSETSGTDLSSMDIQSLSEVSEWLGEINPNFDAFDTDSPYSNNCGSCAYAVFQRLEGNPTACATADNIGYNHEMNALTGMQQVPMTPDEIYDRLLSEGDGAHAIIGIDRAEGPGHWFNAACIDGKVVAIDGQSGEILDWPPDYGDVVNWEMSVRK